MRCRALLFVSLLAALSVPGLAPIPGAHASAVRQYAPKRITISLRRQRLRAWEGNRVVLTTFVTTGDAALPTPTGWFHVYAHFSPYTFISPWPKGSAYYYPPSPVNFALEFLPGYFIHDAPWRSVYGPGSNALNMPGTNYGGTHGCVNVPYAAERFLYFWAPNGILVHIVR